MVMLAMNYVADGERSQWVGSAVVRRGDVKVNIYNDLFPGWFMKPKRDEYETGGGQVSILCRSCLGGIRTINAGTEVYTSRRIVVFNGSDFDEFTDTDEKGREYYRVYSPQLNAGWWFVGVNGESSNGYTWMARLYTLGGDFGMGFQNLIHKYISRDPFFKSPHPSGVGVMGGVGQTIRP
jgi:hypothetical protein